MSPVNRGGWKTCPRGHKYRGAGPCPICRPGGRKGRDSIVSRIQSYLSTVVWLSPESIDDLRHSINATIRDRPALP